MKRIIRAWLCRHGRHKWIPKQRLSKTLVFFTRSCVWCGRFEIENAGPMGDGKWRTVDSAFSGPVGKWEREQFDKANDAVEDSKSESRAP